MVYIEYCNVPMKQVLENKQLLDEIDSILKQGTQIEVSYLQNVERTFRQMFYLGIEDKIPAKQCEEIFEVMKQWDQKDPIPMIAVYPFLKEDNWILPMSKVSNMKVDIRKEEEWEFSIESIEKMKSSYKEEILCLYPYEYEEEAPFEIIEGKKQFRIKFSEREKLQQFMKEILLNGTVTTQ